MFWKIVGKFSPRARFINALLKAGEANGVKPHWKRAAERLERYTQDGSINTFEAIWLAEALGLVTRKSVSTTTKNKKAG